MCAWLMLSLAVALQATAGVIKGTVIDKQTKEPLIGATVQVMGTPIGAVTDMDGNYSIVIGSGSVVLEVKYVAYKTMVLRNVSTKAEVVANVELEPDSQELGEVTVTARKNLENEKMLMLERKGASIAIENLGAKEMSLKGVSTVADGVKKITGISIADAGQLVVRGLGDRYSTTTLNGLPIASPNPDNKLIPLDLFPASTVKNITVSKVYEASAFADYSGAHIDIGTREHTGGESFSFSLSTGGKVNTLLKDFYHSDREGSMFTTPSLNNSLRSMNKSDFAQEVMKRDVFGTSFAISKESALPDLGASLGWGNNWKVGQGQLSAFASVGVSNESEVLSDAYVTTLTASGNALNHFDYDSYTSELKTAGLLGIGYSFRKADRINYTLFYARNAVDNYMRREGTDSEGVDLVGSNSVFHAYTLLNNQLQGTHELGKLFTLDWNVSHGSTGSYEPDRRQVMFRKDGDHLSLFKLNQQETMRYFGQLEETETVGELKLIHRWGEANRITVGGSYKDKDRDFQSTRFYYNLHAINPEITNIYNTNDYLNQTNVANGSITINRDNQPKDSYYAGHAVAAGYVEANYVPIAALLFNVGVRYEDSRQWVRYWNDAALEKRSELNTADLFPAVNVKYSLGSQHSLRLSLSKTVTRPSFVEMAPFLYKEAYGKAEIRGNENLQNGYNYNADLRYEFFSKDNTDLLAVTGYYKKLDSPIERVQQSSGGAAVHSFRNSDSGMAAGVEVELRKELIKDLRFGLNGSYMYTNVKLPEGGGIYTETSRSLQGASPYLGNADLSYTPRWSEEKRMALSLMYNVQGPRIHTVGIYGLGDVVQKAVHTLDFVGSYDFNNHWSVKAQLKDLLNTTVRFEQEIPSTGIKKEVEAYKAGMSVQIGVTYKL